MNPPVHRDAHREPALPTVQRKWWRWAGGGADAITGLYVKKLLTYFWTNIFVLTISICGKTPSYPPVRGRLDSEDLPC